MIVKNLSYRDILKNISFELGKNSICCVLGENGSGKSTLLRSLSGNYKDYTGNIIINEKELKNLSALELYKLRSTLTQHNQLQNHISGRDYIELSTYHKPADCKHEHLLLSVSQALNTVPLLDRDYLVCSGGEQQRLSLSRVFLQALLHDPIDKPYYILLDEPFNSLDIKHIPAIKSYITKLKQLGYGLLTILHDINIAYELCDYILFIKDGQVVDFGPRDLVFTTKNLNLTFDLTFEETHAPGGKRYFSTT